MNSVAPTCMLSLVTFCSAIAGLGGFAIGHITTRDGQRAAVTLSDGARPGAGTPFGAPAPGEPPTPCAEEVRMLLPPPPIETPVEAEAPAPAAPTAAPSAAPTAGPTRASRKHGRGGRR